MKPWSSDRVRTTSTTQEAYRQRRLTETQNGLSVSPADIAQCSDVKNRIEGQAMTLEQLAYLAQIIGVGLVVASLVYVGRQLQQNTQTMRQNAAGYYLNLQDRLCGEVANNRDLAECWHKRASEFDSLDEVDRQRALLFEQRAIAAWNQLFLLRQDGLVPDSQWQELIWSVKHFGSRQSARESWNVSKGSFGGPFQDFISEHMT